MIDPTERFAELLSVEESAIRLDEAMFVIAAHANSGLDVARQLARLDELAARCPSATIEGLAHHLFASLGFTGNRDDYYNPENSFLDRVLDRRLGIPISLSVLAMEVGRRLGVPLLGIGMPGHFLVRSATAHATFIDPFGGGGLMDRAGCIEVFRSVMSTSMGWDDSMLEPIGSYMLLARVLENLQHIYIKRADPPAVAWVRRLLSFVPGAMVTKESSALRRAARYN